MPWRVRLNDLLGHTLRAERGGECEYMALRIQAVRDHMPPATGLQRRKLRGTGAQSSGVKGLRVRYEQVKLCPRCTVGTCWVRKYWPQQVLDSLLRHEAENGASVQLELCHSRYVQSGLHSQYAPIEGARFGLVADVQDQVGQRGGT
jgi:hypothetical protein